MSRLPLAALALALSLPASAREPDPALAAGWTEGMGLLLALQNPFQNGGWLGGYQGFGVGAFWALDPSLALRFGVDLQRSSDPYFSVEETTEAPDGTTTTDVTYGNRWGGATSTLGVALGADVIKRFGAGQVAPYAGGGVALGSYGETTRFVDDVTDEDIVLDVDQGARTTSFGLRGLLGADWRVHRHFSLYAEYALGVGLIDVTAVHGTTTYTDSSGEETYTVSQTYEGKQTRALDLGTGLHQGGAIGVMVMF